MSTIPLLSLPTTLVCAVLGDRLSLKDLVHLDSAICNRQNRTLFTTTLQAKQFTLHSVADIFKPLVPRWLLRRGVKASSIEFSATMVAINVSEFLRLRADSIRDVHFNGSNMDKEMSLVAIYCKNLRIMRCTGTVLSSIFNDVLWCNPGIQEILCKKVTSLQLGLFATLNLDTLKTLYIDEAECKKGFPWSLSASCKSLEKIVLSYCSFNNDTMLWTEACPNIKSLCISRMQVTDSTLTHMAMYASQLCKLSVYLNDTIRDGGVLSILKHLNSLKSLRLQSCGSLTDLSLLHIANTCGGSITELYVDVKTPANGETEQYLHELSQKCVRLQTLCMDCKDQLLCAGGGTCITALHCKQLRTLIVNKITSICESSRRLVAIVRPDLEIAVLDSNNAYNVMSLPT